MGAPLSASFLGLLLMRGKEAAAAEPNSGEAAMVVDAERGPETSDAGAAAARTGAPATASPPVVLAASGALAAPVIDDPTPAGATDTGALELAAANRVAADVPASAGMAETVPPPAPDIGDVVLAFGTEAPFVMPEFGDEVVGSEDENIGDLGDPRLVTREPITPEPSTPPDVPGENAATPPDDAGEPVGNPGLRITGTPQNDYLVGSDGDDIIDAVGGKNTVLAGAGNDLVQGGSGNDVLRGGAGNDTVYGGGGNDEIYADEGDNLLFGGPGNDRLYGGPGNDRLDGGEGTDQLYAGTGNDTLVINDWRDAAIGNREGPNNGGIDTLEVAPGFAASLKGRFSSAGPNGEATLVMGTSPIGRTFPDDVNPHKWQVNADIDQVRLTGDVGHDVIASDQGNTIWGNDGDNRLYGGAGDDVLYAGGGNDVLHGGGGNDTLYAGPGNDVLFGDAGDDIFYAGEGDSELHGGEGDDLFVFGLAEGGKSTIFDHEGVNRLRFDGLENPDDLEARLDGSDLVIGHDGADIVRIADYANHREAFAGIEHEGEVLSLDQFIKGPTTTAALEPAGEDDLLAIYLGPQSVEAPDDILDPAWLDDDGPAHDAPFALYESAADSAFAGPEPAEATAGGADLLGGFMQSEPLWVGPEDGLYVPDQAGYAGDPGDEAQQSKG
jgi:Ca2+-binding RTX toxin-like protein